MPGAGHLVMRRPEVGRLLHDDHVANVRLVLDQQRRESPIGWNISLRPGLGQLIATTLFDQPFPAGSIAHYCTFARDLLPGLRPTIGE